MKSGSLLYNIGHIQFKEILVKFNITGNMNMILNSNSKIIKAAA